jgi:hypothetical protein
MFRHTYQPTILSVVREVSLFGSAAALLFCWLGVRLAVAAPRTVTRDPQALALIASSLQALTGGVTVNDAILQANASYVAGSDQESGTATLTARGNEQGLVQLSLDAGSRQEMRNGAAGAWWGPDGVAHSMATHNCWTDASWFFPALTLEAVAADPQTSVSYLGTDTSKGRALLHLQVTRVPPNQSTDVTALILRLSTMDLYFDPQSFLPLVLDFNTHPDTDANRNIPVEIQFGNFQSISGGLVPFRIQKYLQGSLMLDLVVTNVSINSGVPSSVFTLPPSTGGQS